MIKHYSYKIQDVIQKELFAARHSIKICVAWFTNDLLFQPIMMKLNAGVEVYIILNKDETNLRESNKVNFELFLQSGGHLYWCDKNDPDKRFLHHKFCIIDGRVVISGSYNWTKKAEYNHEDVTVYTEEPDTIFHYEKLFEKLLQKYRVLNEKKQNNNIIFSQSYSIIEYTSTDGNVVVPDLEDAFEGTIVSNTYDKYRGKGVIKFDRKITTIGKEAFRYCANLKRIIIPDGVTGIGECAFDGCTNITNITIPNSVICIGPKAFLQCESLTNIEIPSGVREIGFSAFGECLKLVVVALPNSLEQIDQFLFASCMSLTNIYIPNGVTKIGASAFVACGKLSMVVLPYSVKELNLSAFNHCSNQLCVYINNDIPPIVSTESPIIQKKLDCKFYVPIGSVEVYKNADGWKEYADQIFGFSF